MPKKIAPKPKLKTHFAQVPLSELKNALREPADSRRPYPRAVAREASASTDDFRLRAGVLCQDLKTDNNW